jgi:hypothetical protein
VKVIPNQNTWVGFATTVVDIDAPKASEITAAINVTPVLISINASSTGNTVPTPTLDTLFETSVPGTTAAQFSADFYRDDDEDKDIAWAALPRGTKGYFIISRFGGTGPDRKPAVGQACEVWPVQITSRSMGQMASNTAETFTVTASVPEEPAEDAVVAA